MEQGSPKTSKRFQGRLSRTMTLIMVPIVVIPLIIMAASAYFFTRSIFTQQPKDLLTAVQEEQIDLIDNWFRVRIFRLRVTSQNPALLSALIEAVTAEDQTTQSFLVAHDNVLLNLQTANQPEIVFDRFLVADANGHIFIDSGRQLYDAAFDYQTIYPNDQLTAGSALFYSLNPVSIDSSVVLTHQPILNESGELLATVIGITGDEQIFGLYDQIRFYNTRNYFITAQNEYIGSNDPDDSPNKLTLLNPSDEQGILLQNAIASQQEPILQYTSLQDIEVFGSIRSLQDYHLVLVSEITLENTLGRLDALLPFTIVIFLGTIILSSILIWRGTTRITQPVKEIAAASRQFSQGNWNIRTDETRDDEIGLLSYSFNSMAAQLKSLYQSMESQILERTSQIQTASEVAQIATSGTDLSVILQQTVHLLVDRFEFYQASIYLLDREKEFAVLKESTGEWEMQSQKAAYRLPVGSDSIIGWVAANNEHWISADVTRDPYFQPHDMLPHTQSEVAVPMAVAGHVLGVLDVQSDKKDAFSSIEVTMLQTLANQIAASIENIQILQSTQIDLQQTTFLYQATHKIAEADTISAVYEALSSTLKQTPYINSLMVFRDHEINHISFSDPDFPEQELQLAESFIFDPKRIQDFFESRKSFSVDLAQLPHDIPELLIEIPNRLGCKSILYFPVRVAGVVKALMILGSRNLGGLSVISTEPYTGLLEITVTAIEKIQAIETISERLTELQTLEIVSTSIGAEINLNHLYRIIHEQVTQAMGDLSFLIAIYHPETSEIDVPFISDPSVDITSLPPHPLGSSLTSVVIRTQKPLLLVEDTQRQAEALGARVVGQPAKSWMGVPLLVGGEMIGAIVIQDLENEHRFDDSDLRLMTTISSQVATTIRNARLLEITRKRAEWDQLLYQATNRIQRSPDMATIMAVTADEIGKALKVRKAEIRLKQNRDQDPENGNGS